MGSCFEGVGVVMALLGKGRAWEDGVLSIFTYMKARIPGMAFFRVWDNRVGCSLIFGGLD